MRGHTFVFPPPLSLFFFIAVLSSRSDNDGRGKSLIIVSVISRVIRKTERESTKQGPDGLRAHCRDATKDQICQLLTSPGLGRESSGRNWLTPPTGEGCFGRERRKDVVAEREGNGWRLRILVGRIEKDCGDPLHLPFFLLLHLSLSYPRSSSVSPVVTSASVKSTSELTQPRCSRVVLPLLLWLRATLSC